MWVFRIIYESLLIAWQQLSGNRLRSALSLLGISIGIFCIISVLSAVDSLKTQVIEGFSELGEKVVYVSKFSWTRAPGEDFHTLLQRPDPDYNEYQALKEALPENEVSLYKISSAGIVKYRNNAVFGKFISAVTPEYVDIYKPDISDGRYFSDLEFKTGNDLCLIGDDVAVELFGNSSAIGKELQMKGRKFTIIGKFAKEGESLIKVIPYDDMIMIPFRTGKKFLNYKSRSLQHFLVLEGSSQNNMDEIRDGLITTLRAERKLKPGEGNNFALNEFTQLSKAMDSFFKSLNIAGFIIGGFAILVGMFSVANIMFVSVNERRKNIGIKKSLGARKIVILTEFVVESIILCIFGGAFGMLLVYLVITIISTFLDFQLFLSLKNIAIGISLSVLIGLIAGIIPAYRAASLDPVEAMQ